jgi:hypothetical protein
LENVDIVADDVKLLTMTQGTQKQIDTLVNGKIIGCLISSVICHSNGEVAYNGLLCIKELLSRGAQLGRNNPYLLSISTSKGNYDKILDRIY